MTKQVTISQESLDRIVRSANDAGRDGKRIHTVEIISVSATSDDIWVFIDDDGPINAGDSWR